MNSLISKTGLDTRLIIKSFIYFLGRGERKRHARRFLPLCINFNPLYYKAARVVMTALTKPVFVTKLMNYVRRAHTPFSCMHYTNVQL